MPPRGAARRTVGARELKTRLGTYLREVRRGATVVVTERGHPVAELRPIAQGARGTAAQLAELVALGVLSRESRRPLSRFRPIDAEGAALSTAVLAGRDERG